MTTALVTGASGFIGSHLVEALGKRQVEVRALLRSSSSTENLRGLKYERATGHLGDAASLAQAVRGVNVVFHLAGATAAPNREAYFEANAWGTRRLMAACAQEQSRTGKLQRVVLVSSLAAAGPSTEAHAAREDATPRPNSNYGQSKLQGEIEALKFKDQVPLTILRPPIVYGPRDKQVFLFIQGVARRVVPALRGNNAARDKFYANIYAFDLVDALLLAGLSKMHVPSGSIYFVASEESLAYGKMLDQIGDALGVRPIKVPVGKSMLWLAAEACTWAGKIVGKTLPFNRDKLNEILPDYWTCSIEKARRELEFQPRTPWAEGMKSTVAWCREKGWI